MISEEGPSKKTDNSDIRMGRIAKAYITRILMMRIELYTASLTSSQALHGSRRTHHVRFSAPLPLCSIVVTAIPCWTAGSLRYQR